MESRKIHNKYLMSITEASQYFNIGRDKLYAMVRSQPDMPVLQIGGVTKVNAPMFAQFLDKCTQEGRKL